MSVKAVSGALSTLCVALIASGVTTAQERGAAPKPTESNPHASRASPAEAVDRLAAQLKRHPAPVRPAPDRLATDRFAIDMMDLVDGGVTRIADEPAPGLVRCGSPVWSHDGRRILFDATPGMQFGLSRLKSIELGEGGPIVKDLGAGNCPTFSPMDDRIAYLSNADGAQNGVWLMNADGTERRHLGAYGIPKWSPDSRQMLIVGFGEVRRVTLMDTDPKKSGDIAIPNLRMHSVPSWAGAGMIVAIVGADQGDQVALIDVSDPARPGVKQVLWRKADGPDVTPTWPIYSDTARRCVFVGSDAGGTSLYSIEPGGGVPAKPLSKPSEHTLIVNLCSSPDGRYVLYAANGGGPRAGNGQPVAPDPTKAAPRVPRAN